MAGFPLLVTADRAAVPMRHWERRWRQVPDMAEACTNDHTCNVCGGLIREHVWFLLVGDLVTSDCSEVTR